MSQVRYSRIVFRAPEQAELMEVVEEEPELEPDEVAGSTLVSLISPGTELAVYAGLGGGLPARPGYAAVFQVEEKGSQVEDLQVGDLVFNLGGHASRQRSRRSAVLEVPAGLRAEVAVCARLMGVSMSTLSLTTARPPARVVVSGLGMVGHLAARVFARCGYRVLGCDPLDSRQDLARRAGTFAVAPAIPLQDPAWAGQVDLVVECSGHEQAVLDGCRVVRQRGEVVLVGVPWARRTELHAFEILHAVFHRYVVLRSGWEWELPLHPAEFRPNSIYGNYQVALEWLAAGLIGVEGLCEVVEPGAAPQAYQDLRQRRGPYLSKVFRWNQEQV